MIFFSISHFGASDFVRFYDHCPLSGKLRFSAVCKLLGVLPATLTRYLNGKAAPPDALVRLLYLESSLGRDAVGTHAINGEQISRQLMRSQTDQIAALRATIAALEAECAALKIAHADSSDFAANSPFYAVR